MTEHGCPSSKLNRLSNEGGGRSLSFYRPQRRSLAGLGDRGKTGILYTTLDGELRPFPTMSAFWNLGITYMLILRFRKFATQFFFFLRPVCCCRGADSGLCPASPTSAWPFQLGLGGLVDSPMHTLFFCGFLLKWQKGSVLNKNTPEPVSFKDSGSRSSGCCLDLVALWTPKCPQTAQRCNWILLVAILQRYFFLKINSKKGKRSKL